MSFIWRRYLGLLGSHPYTTKSITSGVLMMSGDVIQQTIEKRTVHKVNAKLRSKGRAEVPVPDYDIARACRMGGFGLVLIGPVFHNWFKLLDRIVAGQTMKSSLGKVLIDQTIMAPCFSVTFFSIMGVLEGQTAPQIKDKLSDALVPTLITNYKIWPAAQLLNLYLIPMQLRVLWLNMVGLGFNIYLSRMNNLQAMEALIRDADSDVASQINPPQS